MQAETDAGLNVFFDSLDHALWRPYWENNAIYAETMPELDIISAAEGKMIGPVADLSSAPLASPMLSISSAVSSPALTALSLSPEPFLTQLIRLNSDASEEKKELPTKDKCRICPSNRDETRERKKIQNRKSAANYRKRRDELFNHLEAENASLRKENFELKQQMITLTSNRYRLFESSSHLKEPRSPVDAITPASNQALPGMLNR